MRASLVNVVLLLMITSCIIFVSAQEGFTSIDCGGNANFTDNATKIQWTTDDGYLLFGQTETLAEDDLTDTDKEMNTVRSFPVGNKNCYELKATNGTKYLVTVKFFYGNFDRESTGSGYVFHLIIDTDVVIPNITTGDDSLVYQLILVAASDIISVCFGKVTGTPFINAIELRTLTSGMYPRASTDSILLVEHYNIQYHRVPVIRYPDDRYDRYWHQLTTGGVKSIQTDEQIRTGNSTDGVPQMVMKTGLEAKNDNLTFEITAENRFQSSVTFFFADFQAKSSRPRKFNIQISIGGYAYGDAGPVQPGYLNTTSIEMKIRAHVLESTQEYVSNITKDNSTLPPVLNAAHIAYVILRSGETHPEDVSAMRKIRDHFEVAKWSGDPCLPLNYSWDKVVCNSDTPARVLSIDMSNMNLTQSVPEAFLNLTALENLNLANNNLFGYLPVGLFKNHLLQIDYSNNPKLRRRIHGLTRTQKNIIMGIFVPFGTIAIVVGLLYLRHLNGRTLIQEDTKVTSPEGDEVVSKWKIPWTPSMERSNQT